MTENFGNFEPCCRQAIFRILIWCRRWVGKSSTNFSLLDWSIKNAALELEAAGPRKAMCGGRRKEAPKHDRAHRSSASSQGASMLSSSSSPCCCWSLATRPSGEPPPPYQACPADAFFYLQGGQILQAGSSCTALTAACCSITSLAATSLILQELQLLGQVLSSSLVPYIGRCAYRERSS